MFEHEWKCHWGQVDPAGIAYYPRLVDAMHEAGEEFMESIGISYMDVNQFDMDLPLVAMDMEFRKPVFVGDTISIEVEPDIGNKSLGFDFTARHEDGEVAFEGHEQHVCVDKNKQSMVIPDKVRDPLEEALE